ncbi:unnamed protein product [Clavelina lepadiformis]|uniref:DUF3456 domain-containing protein n=1 Tax=Clavelina lepadiformis TaxID=159417 RepID=A0ABP0FER8_CLALP
METLHGLVDKGVKVELGMPYELWDEPSVEVTMMKKQCERILEQHEEVVEDWYFNQQDKKNLSDYLCREKVLRKNNQECLKEEWTGKETKYYEEDQEEKRKQKKKKKKAKKEKQKKPRGDLSDSDDSDDDEKKPKDEL